MGNLAFEQLSLQSDFESQRQIESQQRIKQMEDDILALDTATGRVEFQTGSNEVQLAQVRKLDELVNSSPDLSVLQLSLINNMQNQAQDKPSLTFDDMAKNFTTQLNISNAMTDNLALRDAYAAGQLLSTASSEDLKSPTTSALVDKLLETNTVETHRYIRHAGADHKNDIVSPLMNNERLSKMAIEVYKTDDVSAKADFLSDIGDYQKIQKASGTQSLKSEEFFNRMYDTMSGDLATKCYHDNNFSPVIDVIAKHPEFSEQALSLTIGGLNKKSNAPDSIDLLTRVGTDKLSPAQTAKLVDIAVGNNDSLHSDGSKLAIGPSLRDLSKLDSIDFSKKPDTYGNFNKVVNAMADRNLMQAAAKLVSNQGSYMSVSDLKSSVNMIMDKGNDVVIQQFAKFDSPVLDSPIAKDLIQQSAKNHDKLEVLNSTPVESSVSTPNVSKPILKELDNKTTAFEVDNTQTNNNDDYGGLSLSQ